MAPAARYTLRQSWLADCSERWLNPELVRVVRSEDGAALDRFVQRPHTNVVRFPLFSSELVQALLREVHAFEHWCRHHDVSPTRPNSMNEYGVVLAELGLEGAMDGLLDTWLAPIAARYFGAHEGERLDHQHAFIVDYAEGRDTSLDLHVDDSEVTLNACLGLTFEGADVYFCGERCEAHRGDAANDAERWSWAPTPGMAILHAGAHRHGVHPLRAGRRVNLIVWARSSKHRRTHPAAHAGPATWCATCRAA